MWNSVALVCTFLQCTVMIGVETKGMHQFLLCSLLFLSSLFLNVHSKNSRVKTFGDSN